MPVGIEGNVQTNRVPVPDVGAGVGKVITDTVPPGGLTGAGTPTKVKFAGTVSVMVTPVAALPGTLIPMV